MLLGQVQVSWSTLKITGDKKTHRTASASGTRHELPCVSASQQGHRPRLQQLRVGRWAQSRGLSGPQRPRPLQASEGASARTLVEPSNTTRRPEGGAVHSAPAEPGLALLAISLIFTTLTSFDIDHFNSFLLLFILFFKHNAGSTSGTGGRGEKAPVKLLLGAVRLRMHTDPQPPGVPPLTRGLDSPVLQTNNSSQESHGFPRDSQGPLFWEPGRPRQGLVSPK